MKVNQDFRACFRARVMSLTLLVALSLGYEYAIGNNNELQPGSQYRIVGPVYLRGAYNPGSAGRGNPVTRETAAAYLSSIRIAERYWMVFQCQLPVGTMMTILGPAPKVWHLPFFANRYFVRLDPDFSRGLETEVALNRGIEGNLDGLNPELFARVEESKVETTNSLPTSPPCKASHHD